MRLYSVSGLQLHSVRVGLFLAISLTLSPLEAADGVEVLAEVAKLRMRHASEQDYFGISVALEGDRLIVGATRDDESGEDAGAVFIFERRGDGEWRLADKLIAPDAEPGDLFGSSVSLDGDRLAVGAFRNAEDGSFSTHAYIFEREPAGDWRQMAKLLGLEGREDEKWGGATSLDGDRLAFGAPDDDEKGWFAGSVLIFERNPSEWTETARLYALSGSDPGLFGQSISMDGDRLGIGSSCDDNGWSSGCAFVFERETDGAWTQVSLLVPSDGQILDDFGGSVSLDGDRMVVGAAFGDGREPDSGSAYVFERDPTGEWFQSAKIVATDGYSGASFGESISLDEDRVAIGASLDDESGWDFGAAYVFERAVDGRWVQADKLLASDGRDFDRFGSRLSLDGENLAVGVRLADGHTTDSGSAYLFEPVFVSPRLTLIGSCPGSIELISSGTTPRADVRLYGAAGKGTSTIANGPCAGTKLDLESPLSSDTPTQGSTP